MSIAKRIAAKHAAQERGCVEVEEWGEDGQPLRLYFHPVTARDVEKVQRKHPNFLEQASLAAMIDMIIEKSQDEAGNRTFTIEDKPILMGETVKVIANVFGSIFSSTSIESHEKN